MPQNTDAIVTQLNADLVNQFGAADLANFANLLLNNHQKILGATELLWDNWDDMMEVVEYVMDHRAQIAEFLSKVPEFLGKTGDLIQAAGVSATQASAFLTGDDKRKESVSARDLADLAANALDNCQDELKSVAELMARIGKQFDNVKIPTLKPEYSKVMGFEVITGLELGESSFIDDAADQLRHGAQRIEQIGASFQNVAQQMRKMGGVLTDAGGDLRNVGNHLQESSVVLQSISQLTAAEKSKPATKATKPRIKDAPSFTAARGSKPTKPKRTGPLAADEPQLKPLRPLREQK